MKDEKILENEKLSDEDLEKVVGGCYKGYEDDKKFLRAMGFPIGSSSDIAAYHQLFKDCWGKCGVAVRIGAKEETHYNYGGLTGGYSTTETVYIPHYFVGGHEVSQSQARKHAMMTTGKILDITEIGSKKF